MENHQFKMSKEYWTHLKNDTDYSVIGKALLQTSSDKLLKDGDTLVIYKNEKLNMCFAREYHEFHDGRFVSSPIYHAVKKVIRDNPDKVEQAMKNPHLAGWFVARAALEVRNSQITYLGVSDVSDSDINIITELLAKHGIGRV